MLIRVAFLLTLTTFVGSYAQAAVFYNVRFDNLALNLNPGQMATLNVFFDETVTGGDPHRLDETGGMNGLVNANFSVIGSGGGGSLVTAATPNAGFDASTVTIGDPTSSVQQAIVFNGPVFGNGDPVRSVQLGTVTFTAGTAGDINVFDLADFNTDPGAFDFTIGDGFGGLISGAPDFSADSSITFGSTTISVTAVPEPSSIAVMTFIGGIAAYRIRRRRRRRKAVKVVE